MNKRIGSLWFFPLALHCFGTCAMFIAAQDARMSDAAKAALRGAVEVILTTDKTVYRMAEPITIRAELRNAGTQALYVFPTVRFGQDGNGVFRVYLKPLKPCQMEGVAEFADEAMADEGLIFSDYIEKNWQLLQPGESLILISSNIVRVPCPGKYELRGNYFTKLQAWSFDRIKAGESKLKHPAVYGSFAARPSIIKVQSKATLPRW
jgi:hypothetical protein